MNALLIPLKHNSNNNKKIARLTHRRTHNSIARENSEIHVQSLIKLSFLSENNSIK